MSIGVGGIKDERPESIFCENAAQKIWNEVQQTELNTVSHRSAPNRLRQRSCLISVFAGAGR
jgi:hypothetical protein